MKARNLSFQPSSKTKECRDCDGVGRIYQNGAPDEQDPKGIECIRCGGFGEIELTEDELQADHEARIEDEAERMNDKFDSKN